MSTYTINQKRAGYTDKSYDYYANMPQSARTGYEESKSNFIKKEKTNTCSRYAGFPERKPITAEIAVTLALANIHIRESTMQYQREKYRKKPSPTPDTFDGISPEDYEKAEEAMKKFWETGEFPFSFAKTPLQRQQICLLNVPKANTRSQGRVQACIRKQICKHESNKLRMGVNQPRVYSNDLSRSSTKNNNTKWAQLDRWTANATGYWITNNRQPIIRRIAVEHSLPRNQPRAY